MSTTSNLTSTFAQDDDAVPSCNSQLKYREFSMNWTIEDFEFICKNIKVLESPKFPPLESENVKWYLRLEPAELKDGNEEEFKIFLKNTDGVEKYIDALVSFNYSSGNGPSFHHEFQSFNINESWSKSGSEFYKQLLCNNSLPKNVTVTCNLRVLITVKDVFQKRLTNTEEPENLLPQVESFFDDEAFKDVTFNVGEDEFTAHKTILALRSPVFAAIFKSKISEQVTFIHVEDINSSIFQQMLRFIYTDKVEDLKDSATELFHAAENYQLEKLKKICINSLYKNLSLETVVKTLKFADKFSIFKLKKTSLEYLIRHVETLKDTEEFEDLVVNRPHLAEEILKEKKSDYDNEYSNNTIFELR